MTERPEECTALGRAWRRTGRQLPFDMLKNIGVLATRLARERLGQELPKMWEYHPNAPREESPNGWLAVAVYQGPALALLDEAIDTFLRLAAQKVPPIPSDAHCPWCRGEMRNAQWQELCKEHLRQTLAYERRM